MSKPEETAKTLAWLNAAELGGLEDLEPTTESLAPPPPETTAQIDLSSILGGGQPRAVAQPGPGAATDPGTGTMDVGQKPALPLVGRLGRFGILGKLGEGGMGVVYLAREGNLRRKVALKHGGERDDAETRERFLVEAQITAQLDHPGIVPVYGLEAGADGALAYAMKVVAGEEMADRIKRADDLLQEYGPGSPELKAAQEELLGKLIRVCEAVHFAHSRGVIHRDLKPENLMLGEHEEVYVMDWGLAKFVGAPEPESGKPAEPIDPQALAEDTRTLEGIIKGTPLYMAPEQAEGDPALLSPAADVYALGLILYEILYLQRARAATTVIEAVELAKQNELAPPPYALDPGPELKAVLAWATATKPEDRIPNARELAHELQRVLRHDETKALPDQGWRKLRRWILNNPTLFAGLAAGLVALGLFTIVGLSMWQQVELAEQRLASERRTRAENRVRRAADEALDQVVKHFLYYASLSGSLAASTQVVLEHGQPQELLAFPPGDFADPATAPAGSTLSAGYGGRLVSPRAMVGQVPPGTPPDDLRLLSLMLDPLRQTVLAGQPGALARWQRRSASKTDAAIVAHDAPLEWAYVALERSGAIVLFPGSTSTWDETYDPRQRSWYREAKQAYETRGQRRNWSHPYRDLMGQGIVITCTEAVLDDEGGFQGLVALDLSFEDAAQTYLALPELPGLQRATIVLDSGEVFMRTDLALAKERDDGTLDLGTYDPQVVAAIQAGVVDHLRRGEQLTLWTRARRLGWSLVVDVHEPTLTEAIGVTTEGDLSPAPE